jgi:phenylalanyl-tRNA synthetase beta chain
LTNIEYNQNRYNPDLKTFEIGRIFIDNGSDELPDQPVHFAIAITGKRSPDFWGSKSEPVDFYDLKGLIESLFNKLHLDSFELKQDTGIDFLDRDYSVQIYLNGEKIGLMGKISNSFARVFDIEKEVFYADFCLDDLINYIARDKKYKTIGKYPYIEKDLALILENKIPSADVIEFIKGQGGKLLRNVDIFDVYSGKNIGEGLKSIAFRLKFQSDERTLNDKEVDQIFRKIIKKSETEFNASLRDK